MVLGLEPEAHFRPKKMEIATNRHYRRQKQQGFAYV